MRKYWTRDYAVNKGREGIVYQFADGICYEQALEDTRYKKQKQSPGKLEDSGQFATPSVDALLIQKAILEQRPIVPADKERLQCYMPFEADGEISVGWSFSDPFLRDKG